MKYWNASISGFPPSLIPALRNIGILHHKKEELRILLQQSVPSLYKLAGQKFFHGNLENLQLHIFTPTLFDLYFFHFLKFIDKYPIID